jgi:hypothetical protein
LRGSWSAPSPEGATRAQRREIRELALGIIESGVPDRQDLAVLITELQRVGPLSGFAAFRGTPRDLANGIVSMMVAMTRYEELTDGIFLEARFRLRSAALSYVLEYPQLLANPDAAGTVLEQPRWSGCSTGRARTSSWGWACNSSSLTCTAT